MLIHTTFFRRLLPSSMKLTVAKPPIAVCDLRPPPSPQLRPLTSKTFLGRETPQPRRELLAHASQLIASAASRCVDALIGDGPASMGPQLAAAGVGMLSTTNPAYIDRLAPMPINRALMVAQMLDGGSEAIMKLSSQELIAHLQRNGYDKIGSIKSALKSLNTLPDSVQDRNLRIAFKLIDWKASISTIIASLLYCCPDETLNDPKFKDGKSEIEEWRALNALECNWSNEQQYDYFRSLLFLKSTSMGPILLLAAGDLIDLEQMTSAESRSEILEKKAKRSYFATAWALKFLGYEDLGGSKLEDLAFLHINRQEYRDVERRIHEAQGVDRKQALVKLQDIAEKLDLLLSGAQIQSLVKFRVKTVTSARNRALRRGYFEDNNGIRLILPSNVPADCYQALFTVRDYFEGNGWEMIKDKYKDYIARPKPNSYQSLHLTFQDSTGYIIEIQIRTKEMDRNAEIGKAFHGGYKGGVKSSDDLDTGNNYAERRFLEKRKGMLDAGVVFIYDGRAVGLIGYPKIIKLVSGSGNRLPTLLDFAFARAVDDGLYAVHGSIDGKISQLGTELKNGQSVDVVRNHSMSACNRLKYLNTPFARAISSVATIDPLADLHLEYRFSSLVNKGRSELNRIQTEIEAELYALKALPSTDRIKFSYSLSKLWSRMGFENENQFLMTLAVLPDNDDKKSLISDIKKRLRMGAVMYSVNTVKGKSSLNIVTLDRPNFFSALMNRSKVFGLEIRSLEYGRIAKSSHSLAQFTLSSQSDEALSGFISEVSDACSQITDGGIKSNRSVSVTLRIRRNFAQQETLSEAIETVIDFGADVISCSIPEIKRGEDAEILMTINLPFNRDKAKSAKLLSNRLDGVKGVRPIIIT